MIYNIKFTDKFNKEFDLHVKTYKDIADYFNRVYFSDYDVIKHETIKTFLNKNHHVGYRLPYFPDLQITRIYKKDDPEIYLKLLITI